MNNLEAILELKTIDVAKKLLGHFLVSKYNNKILVGKIVETEAYLYNDPACHSYKNKTKRNSMMYVQAGTSYVYFTYGMHYCINVVTSDLGIGEAVLIRALEPIAGIAQMQINRSKKILTDLCSGPAKLTQAFNITLKDNGIKLLDINNPIHLIYNNDLINDNDIVQAQRIGISKAKDMPYRFYIKDSIFVSKK
ncbi:3-methyladenine DNA glycosylase [Francisella persica ATCC VR-331]|uniref:Putative 3-methyladenine DNA glycosylase n=1 Tax=Francisella persica ATCC VR-331 TaxID=1086726 RepID=A0AAC8ZMR9_9GAMM|nr:DNA-3-methyladenine glycosylase [Francisella persica]ALB01772.1 3-methyladenine DNA glycosylase [Francisella persica ATCC VR-331]ANH78078.1 3-methyladenine DNA glycosylase [Francisella persica ATCC VR-331]